MRMNPSLPRAAALLLAAALLFILVTGCAIQIPASVAELISLGERYLLDLDYEQALVQFLKIIEIDPMNPRGYTGAAEAYVGLDWIPDAIAILEQGLSAIGPEKSIQGMLDELQGGGGGAGTATPAPESPGVPASETTPAPIAESTPELTPEPVADPTPEPTPEPAPSQTPAPDFIQPPEGINIGETAPNFTLSLRGGGIITLWDLRGQPVLLNVCTTWCPPCQNEFPEIQALYEAYVGRVYVMGISSREDIRTVDDYFDRYSYTYPLAYDPDDLIDADYNIEFIPQTWVIDENGVITDYIAGATTFRTFSASLEKMLG